MTKAESKRINTIKKTIVIAVNNFDNASQDWGWTSDQGSVERVDISRAKYEEEKKVLLSLIDSI